MTYYIVYGFVKLLSLLPFAVLYALSDVLYPVIYYIIGYRKQVVRDNLSYSFPEKTEQERKTIEKKFYRHFCDLIFENIKFAGISVSEINKRMLYLTFVNF